MRYLMSFCVLAAGVSLAWVSGADESTSKQATVAVETLLPASCFTALTYDGTENHLPAIKETAAWKALEETELTARLLDIAHFENVGVSHCRILIEFRSLKYWCGQH